MAISFNSLLPSGASSHPVLRQQTDKDNPDHPIGQSFGRFLSQQLSQHPGMTNDSTGIEPLDPARLQQLIRTLALQLKAAWIGLWNGADEDAFSQSDSPDRLNLQNPGPQAFLPPVQKNTLLAQQSPVLAADVDDIIHHASRTFDVDPDLTRAVIRAESAFNSESTSPKGAIGLMQLMPATAQELGVQNPYDPVENVMGGTRYLKKLLDRYEGNVPLALAAYNWGMGNVERHPERLPEETRTYITRVQQFYQAAKLV